MRSFLHVASSSCRHFFMLSFLRFAISYSSCRLLSCCKFSSRCHFFMQPSLHAVISARCHFLMQPFSYAVVSSYFHFFMQPFLHAVISSYCHFFILTMLMSPVRMIYVLQVVAFLSRSVALTTDSTLDPICARLIQTSVPSHS